MYVLLIDDEDFFIRPQLPRDLVQSKHNLSRDTLEARVNLKTQASFFIYP